MEHVTDLTGLAFVVLTALACGMVLAHFRQPPLVGYLLASVMMSQLGEFSFLLAAAGLAVAAISPEEAKLIISVTVLMCWPMIAISSSPRNGGLPVTIS